MTEDAEIRWQPATRDIHATACASKYKRRLQCVVYSRLPSNDRAVAVPAASVASLPQCGHSGAWPAALPWTPARPPSHAHRRRIEYLFCCSGSIKISFQCVHCVDLGVGGIQQSVQRSNVQRTCVQFIPNFHCIPSPHFFQKRLEELAPPRFIGSPG